MLQTNTGEADLRDLYASLVATVEAEDAAIRRD